jgi:hypothetical protein
MTGKRLACEEGDQSPKDSHTKTACQDWYLYSSNFTVSKEQDKWKTDVDAPQDNQEHRYGTPQLVSKAEVRRTAVVQRFQEIDTHAAKLERYTSWINSTGEGGQLGRQDLPLNYKDDDNLRERIIQKGCLRNAMYYLTIIAPCSLVVVVRTRTCVNSERWLYPNWPENRDFAGETRRRTGLGARTIRRGPG